MQSKAKRILYAVGALLVAAALAVGGTFAYQNLTEQKSNTLEGMAQYQARLVEDYAKNPEWKKDAPIKKDVRVRNMGGVAPEFPGSNWGDIYVGLQLLEYMDITPFEYTYITGADTSSETGLDPIRFMVDTSGNFVRLPGNTDINDKTALRAAIVQATLANKVIGTGAANSAKREAFINALVEREWLKTSGYYDKDTLGNDVEYYYLPTIEGDPNGQYGAYIVKDAKEVTADRELIAGKKRLTADGQKEQPYAEYEKSYDPLIWKDDARVREYIEVVLGTEGTDWMYLSDWNDSMTVKMWLLDDSPTGNGWAYWSAPLTPGETTKPLVNSLRPLKDAEDKIYYDLYVHMAAYSLGEMPEGWPLYKAPAFRAVAQTSVTVAPGGTVTFKSFMGAGTGTEVTDGTTWTLSKTLPSGVSLFSLGDPKSTLGGSILTEAPGLVTLTIGAAEADGPLYVIAEYQGQKGAVEVTVQSAPAVPDPVITTPTVPTAAKVGTAISECTFTATNGPVTWSVVGDLPPGLTLNPTTGKLSGTPAQEADGPYTFKVKATNAEGGSAETAAYTITVSPADPTSLDVNPNGPDGNPHQPKGGDVDASDIYNNFYPYGYIKTDDRVIDFTDACVAGASPHFGGIKLADVINGSITGIDIDYATLNDPRFNEDTLYMGEVHGVPCIVWAYAPTLAEFNDFVDSGVSDDYFWIDLTIPLTNGTLDGSINVRMLYSGGCVWQGL